VPASDGGGGGGGDSGGVGAAPVVGRSPADLGHWEVGHWDLIVAADVVGYIGELGALFENCAALLRPGTGLLALTAERLPADSEPGPSSAESAPTAADGPGVALLPSGRLGHSERYLRETAKAAELEVAACEGATLRFNLGEPVDAILLVLRAPGEVANVRRD
jgi:predicted TPR repeat methyltransferase